MRTLLIDNYDSFTWNLAQYIGEVNGEEPVVVLNNTFSWAELMKMGPFDSIVLSPGPGTVESPGDFGVSRAAIEYAQVPLLGVCLGHQGIAHVHGARVVHAPEPVHGRLSTVHHDGDPLFAGIPSPWQVVRYHSLAVVAPLPAMLMDIARTEGGLLMGLRHRQRPLWGVQFHPESILTEHGHRLMRNFRDIAHKERLRRWVPVHDCAAAVHAGREVVAQKLHTELGAEDLFVGLYGRSDNAFWLDSALVAEGLSRFSYMGEAGTDGVLAFRCNTDRVARQREGEAFLNDLEERLAAPAKSEQELPFAFRGGWVGYFGYEMKALFGAEAAHFCEYPDSMWLHVDRFIAIDHQARRCWAVSVAPKSASPEAEQWRRAISRRVADLAPAPTVALTRRHDEVPIALDQAHARYLESIAACKRAIRNGESYQVCLTNKMKFDGTVNGLQLYRLLRASNPAPFAAYVRIGELEIISASPERFLQVDSAGRIETKPIKGTCRRDADPAKDRELAEELRLSEKNRAENLMIVDLLRNDLSRVAETGSVAVPRLMYIESYATLHQLVSTVTAQLRPECSLIDLIRATFPGGSITGAPKLRTMQIIDGLERSARGVYCGAIGYLGYNRVMDLSIVIRTMVAYNNSLSFGVGGGITHLSDNQDEFEETLLKAYALIRALCRYLGAHAELPHRFITRARADAAPPDDDAQTTATQTQGEVTCSVS